MLRQSLSILKQLGSAGRSQDATVLLHEDLVQVEPRVEPAKKAAQVLHKRLLGCLQSQPGLETERRMKKLPLMQLSVSMAESLKDFDAESSIRKVLEMCCFMEKMLAHLLADFEMKVEKDVLEPLNKLSEEDLPEILRNKKQFAKLTADWHSARARSQSQSSTAPQAKQDCLREEVEEAWRRLENMKDQYSADLYHFASKESDYANYFIHLLELQEEYHKSSHKFLEQNIRELKENQNQSQRDPPSSVSTWKVYGAALVAHLTQSDRHIAAPIEECVTMLLRTGMREEGLFRLAAAASVVKRLKTCLDQGTVDHSEFSMDPHAVAGALKCYLRELPEPLLTFNLYSDWFKAAGEKDSAQKLQQFRVLLKKLPPENYNNLRYLVQFLSLLSEQQAVNKMSPSNIAIVLGPNLLWPRAEGEAALLDMASASSVQVVTVIEPLIQHCSSLFPEAVPFEVPDVPESSNVSLPPPTVPKEKLSRTISSSSSASSTSTYHPCLSKTNSTASQDGGGSFLVKSSSFSRGSTTTWGGPVGDPSAPAGPQNPPNTNASASAPPPRTCGLAAAAAAAVAVARVQVPAPLPRSTSTPGPVLTRSPTQKQNSEQLEPILEASPRVMQTPSHPNKPKRNLNPNKPGEQPQPPQRPPVLPKLQAPPPPPPSQTADTGAPPTAAPRGQAAATGTRRPAPKKPSARAPNCPPPLPPTAQAKELQTIAQ